mmetsp:Transcript_71324/g.209067  ORF Transcript_71324/g.209067 Transcript_71324/m.209067 type:complete len:140 (-) Transcript_71324:316-735(-)
MASSAFDKMTTSVHYPVASYRVLVPTNTAMCIRYHSLIVSLLLVKIPSLAQRQSSKRALSRADERQLDGTKDNAVGALSGYWELARAHAYRNSLHLLRVQAAQREHTSSVGPKSSHNHRRRVKERLAGSAIDILTVHSL